MEWNEKKYPMDYWRKESALARFQLEGKKAFITGGAGGLGREIAGAFAEAGADVALVDLPVKEEFGRNIADEISKKFGTRAIYVNCDVSSDTQIKEMIQTICKEFGTIDISVNNAGYCGYDDTVDISLEKWNQCIAVNLTGCMLSARYAAEIMKQDGHGGAIINTASLMGIVAAEMHNNQSGAFTYGVTKAGIILMTRTMAAAWAKEGVRVNSVSPGFAWSGIHEGMDEDSHDYMSAHVPIGRFGYTKEVASAYLYLASEASSYVTGTNLMVDGGYIVY